MIFLFFYLLKAVKDIYVEMMEAYKEGFNSVLVGFQQEDENMLNEGTEKMSEALELLEEYNAGLEALADDLGLKIEY